MKKQIKITSKVEYRMPLGYLNPLQGKLKTRSAAAKEKLKKSILKFGFFLPFFIWESPLDAQFYILDGHGRKELLKEMQDEGYQIPDLPVVLIEAETEEEAKQKLLAVTSQYGKFDEQGVFDFTQDMEISELDFAEIPFLSFELPNILEPDEGKTIQVGAHERVIPANDPNEEYKGMPEFSQEDKTSYRHIVVHFDSDNDAEVFAALIGQQITDKTRSMWYPCKDNMDTESKRYG